MTEFPSVMALKAIGDQSRLRILMALHKGELCVCQIVELLQLAHSTVSKHLSILKAAELVTARKQGRWIYYDLAQKDLPGFSFSLIDSMLTELGRTAHAREDSRRLKDILSIDPEVLCERQRG